MRTNLILDLHSDFWCRFHSHIKLKPKLVVVHFDNWFLYWKQKTNNVYDFNFIILYSTEYKRSAQTATIVAVRRCELSIEIRKAAIWNQLNNQLQIHKQPANKQAQSFILPAPIHFIASITIEQRFLSAVKK